MQISNFSNEQFVDNVDLDNAFQNVLLSIRELTANNVFFNPGLVNPSAVSFSYNGNLIVTVNAPAPFKCLFLTGAYAYANGIVAGVVSSTYQVSFATLVPGSGSVVAYIVAAYFSLQSGAIIINGPPPGHPDFSAGFNAYLAYTELLDSVNIYATTTAPDNVTTLEIARTTLIAGQTQIVSGQLDTTHQVIASLNVPAETVTLSGDITGPANNTYISKLQSLPVNASAPNPGQVLGYTGTQWAPVSLPTSLPPSGPAGGDLYSPGTPNNYPNPLVGGIRGVAINSTPPVDGQYLKYVGTANQVVWSGLNAVNQANTVSLNSDINPVANNTNQSVVSVNITLPAGLWRILTSINLCFQVNNGGSNANPVITGYVQDNFASYFALSVYGSGLPPNIGTQGAISSTGVSPLYNGGQTITLTAYIYFTDTLGSITRRIVRATPNGAPSLPGALFTYLSYIVIPAAA